MSIEIDKTWAGRKTDGDVNIAGLYIGPPSKTEILMPCWIVQGVMQRYVIKVSGHCQSFDRFSSPEYTSPTVWFVSDNKIVGQVQYKKWDAQEVRALIRKFIRDGQ
jgi:hypothetical protein